MRQTVKLEGFKELEAQLERLTKATGKAALRRAGMSALEPTARLARSLAPEDTGELIESIDVSAKATGAGANIGKAEFSAVLRSGGSREAAVSALRGARRAAKGSGEIPHIELFMGPEKAATKDEAIKAWAQEFGTSTMAATPYMRPAWDQDKGAMLERLKKDLWFEVSAAVVKAQARQAKAEAG